jgi:hypothetical protein
MNTIDIDLPVDLEEEFCRSLKKSQLKDYFLDQGFTPWKLDTDIMQARIVSVDMSFIVRIHDDFYGLSVNSLQFRECPTEPRIIIIYFSDLDIESHQDRIYEFCKAWVQTALATDNNVTQ